MPVKKGIVKKPSLGTRKNQKRGKPPEEVVTNEIQIVAGGIIEDATDIYTAEDIALVNAYFELGMNKTRAYMKVHGLDESKYNSARSSAPVVFAKPSILALIKYTLDKAAMPVEEALALKAQHARASLRPFIRVDDDGFVYFDFSHPEAMENMHLIREMETKRERRIEYGKGEDEEDETFEGEWVKVKLVDTASAISDILKMHGKFIDRVKVEGEIIITPKKKVGVDMNKI